MRVLCFGRFCDDIPGGMQRHVEHLFRALKGQVEFVHLVPSRNGRGSVGELEGFPVIRKPSLNLDGSLAVSPALVTEARRLHHEKPFDLVHLHFPDPMTHLASLALPSSVPRVISWHADIVRYPRGLAAYRPLLRRALDSAAAVIVATDAHIEHSAELRRWRCSDRLHTVPYGFDLKRFAVAAPGRDSVAARYPGRRIFALGRHVYYKGFDVLIRAAARLPEDVQVIIGGAGPLTERWRQLASELGVVSRVHFPGLISEADLSAYYQAAELFCLPAVCEAEAFGIVQVEAMAAARPVVSSALKSGVALVNRHGETGLLVPPHEPSALAAALIKVLDDDGLRERLGRRAQARAFDNYSSDAMGRRILAIYEACLDTAGERCVNV